MSFYVWLLPIIFIFHDMEEIIGFIPWLNSNKEWLEKKYSKFVKPYNGVTTERFAMAVFEQFFLAILICIISYVTDFYGIWIGAFVGMSIHFVIHIVESVVIRKYIPALITSIICIPVSCIVIGKSVEMASYSMWEMVLYSVVGSSLIAVNLKIAHGLMRR